MRTERNSSIYLIDEEIKPYYKEQNKSIYLIIPTFTVKTSLVNPIECKIYNGPNLIHQQQIKPYRFSSGFSTPILNIKLDQLSGNEIEIEIKINYGSINLYDSKQALKRDFILFYNGNEITDYHLAPGNYFLYTTDIDSFTQIPVDRVSLPFKNLYSIQAKRGSRLQKGHRLIWFDKPKKNVDVSFDRSEIGTATLYFKGQKYSILDGELYLRFDQDLDLYGYKLCYGDFSFPLSYFICPRGFDCPLEQSAEKISIIVPLEDYIPTKIEIFNSLENKVEDRIRVVKCAGLKIHYDKGLYCNKDKLAEVSVSLGPKSIKRQFLIRDGEASFDWPDPKHNIEASLFIPLPVLRIKMDDGNFMEQFNQNLWAQNISETAKFTISLPDSFKYEIVDDLNNPLIKIDTDTFLLGKYIHSNISQREGNSIYLKLSNGKKFQLFTISRHARFEKDPFILQERKLIWKPKEVFIGPDNPSYELLFRQNGTILKRITLSNNACELILYDLKPGKYECVIDLKNGARLFKSEVIIGSRGELRFADAYIKITKVLLANPQQWKEIEPVYIDKIKLVQTIDGFDTYTGEIFVRALGQKVYVDRMTDNNGEDKKTNPVRIDVLNETNCTLLPGVDPENINNCSRLFSLDKNGVISIKTGKKKMSSIKRFQFEVIREE